MGFEYYLTSAKAVSGNDETLGSPTVLDNLTSEEDVCKSLIREMCKEPCLMHLLISQEEGELILRCLAPTKSWNKMLFTVKARRQFRGKAPL